MNNPRRRFLQPKFDESESFIITVETTSSNETFTLPLLVEGTYNFNSDWGDGQSDTITVYNQAEATHTYTSAGTYDVAMNGIIEDWSFNNSGDKLKIIDVKQWGGLNGVKLKTNGSFYGCSNLDITATDIPNLSIANNLNNCFRDCASLVYNTSINDWVVSGITSISNIFSGCTLFNQPLNSWDTSSVIAFDRAFFMTSSFNQALSSWDVSNGTTFERMFTSNPVFNQDLSDWVVSSSVNFIFMFSGCTAFNNGGSANINNWTINTTPAANVIMHGMFQNCPNFNQPLGSWNMSEVTSIFSMFEQASIFNQNLGAWNVSKVTSFADLFYRATQFNNGGSADINNWNVSSVTDMSFAFGNTSFNQPLNLWDTSSVTTLQQTFRSSPFNQNISSWDVSNVVNMISTFFANSVFNQPIGAWTTSSLEDIRQFIGGSVTPAFDQDLSNWDVSNLDSANSAFQNCNFSTLNYDATLIGWEAQLVQNDVVIDFGSSQYSSGGAAETARTNLINDHNWTITDGGGI